MQQTVEGCEVFFLEYEQKLEFPAVALQGTKAGVEKRKTGLRRNIFVLHIPGEEEG